MATTLNIPMPFLWKILRKLGQRKLVRSFKGVRGGYELARPAKTIHVAEILKAGRDTDPVGRCILGLAQCSDQELCQLHSHWKDLRAQIEATLETTTSADLASSAQQARRKRSNRRHAPARVSSLS